MLALESVSVKAAAGDYRVRDVSLTMSPGEVLAVLGPNGAGKSTLVGLLSGSLSPDVGRVTLDGTDLTHYPKTTLARRRAVLPQENALGFRFRVEDVVALGRSPHAGCGRAIDQQAIAWAMSMADVEHLSDRDYLTLSGGERQRVHLARVLAQLDLQDGPLRDHGDRQSTRYLLLDEPTSALDLAHQQGVLSQARHLAHEADVGVLAILHDPNLAALHADRIVVVDQGRLVAMGTPADVLSEMLFDDVFQLSVMVVPHPQHPDRPLIVTHRDQARLITTERPDTKPLAVRSPLVQG